LTAAVDKRVFAAAPVVAPLLNLNEMVNEIYMGYGMGGRRGREGGVKAK
jgi:PhoPQ-activated pathogenicity-related protein